MNQMIVENPQKTKTVRELGLIDISSIQDDIVKLSQDYWDMCDRIKPNNFGQFPTTQHIVFKFVTDYNQAFPDLVEYPVWDEWKDKLEPVMKVATEPYGYLESTFGKIMLAKLKSGGKINMHTDSDLDTCIEPIYPHKIHIPITTNPDTKFFVGNQTYELEVGKAYEVNNIAFHGAANEGDCDRIHLIFTYYDRKLNVVKAENPELISTHLREQIQAMY